MVTKFDNFIFLFQQMERFRIVEKETKTKAYSKEGDLAFLLEFL